MATIQNQAIIQKLVDELELYPALDKVPTELAEKILPVFQINSEIIEVSPKTANIVRTNATICAGNTKVIYATPSTGKFYLTNVALSVGILQSGGNDPWGDVKIRATIGGSVQVILVCQINHASAQYGEPGQSNSLNLQNPVLIDAGTNIEIIGDDVVAQGWGTIIGYTD